jgi:protein-S-isoprenylcysteine O-methyltransferase Ste14
MFLAARKSIALVILIITAIIGAASYMAFMIFLYMGSLDWVNLSIGEVERLVVNTLLSLAFFLQHSIMVRKPFRRRLSSFIPTHYQEALYTIASGLVLLAFVALWQDSEKILLGVHGLPSVLMRSFYFLSLLGICWGMWVLRLIDVFGLDPIIKNLQAKPSLSMPFTIRGPYRWVRHPLYLFMIVLFWSCPILTTDSLLFNILWTVWVIVGTILEERDLAEGFGDAYRAYQANVPMLFPQGFRPAYPLVHSSEADPGNPD